MSEGTEGTPDRDDMSGPASRPAPAAERWPYDDEWAYTIWGDLCDEIDRLNVEVQLRSIVLERFAEYDTDLERQRGAIKTLGQLVRQAIPAMEMMRDNVRPEPFGTWIATARRALAEHDTP